MPPGSRSRYQPDRARRLAAAGTNGHAATPLYLRVRPAGKRAFAGPFGPGHAGHADMQWNWMAVRWIRLFRNPPPGTTLGGPMLISPADVEKLRTIHAPEPAILSL